MYDDEVWTRPAAERPAAQQPGMAEMLQMLVEDRRRQDEELAEERRRRDDELAEEQRRRDKEVQLLKQMVDERTPGQSAYQHKSKVDQTRRERRHRIIFDNV